jgi:hypothetical protein
VTSSVSCSWSSSFHGNSTCGYSSFFIKSFSNIVIVQKFSSSGSLSLDCVLGSNSSGSCLYRVIENFSRLCWVPWSLFSLSKACWCLPVSSRWSTSHHGNSTRGNSGLLVEGLSNIIIIQKFSGSSSLGFDRIFSSNSGCSRFHRIIENFS